MVYKFFDKRSKGGGVNIPLEFNEHFLRNYTNQLL